jgi:very-short-patch-repair endonuclease
MMTTADLRDAGIGDRLLAHGVRLGAVVRIRHGVYMPAHLWSSLIPWARDIARLDAHIAAARGTPVYCLSSAAVLHGMPTWNAGQTVHVATRYAGARSSRSSDTLTHELGLDEADVVTVERRGRRVRVTSAVRTLVDCFRFLPYEQALVIGDSAVHRGLADVHSIEQAVARASRRGRRRALTVVEALEPRTESPGESRTRALLHRLGFEKPVVQLRLETGEGEYRADFAWPELMIIIEFDGEGKYTDYAPTPDVLLAERRRETLLMEEGWIFVRLRWADLERPEDVRRRLAAAIAQAARRSA